MSDKQVDEINLKDLSKKIAQSSGNKNVIKAMKPSVDKTKSDLAAMRKRLDALKAGYATESVEEANTYVGQRDKMKIVDRKPHPEGGHIVTLQTRTGKTIKRRLHKGKVTDMNEDLQIDEVLDTPKAMQSYRDKAKYSADRAASSAAAKILRGKDKDGNRADHSPEVKTRDKRAKGLKMVDRNATRKVFKALRKEETQIDEASKEGTIRIIDLGRMGKGKGFQVQRMTKGKFVDQGKPYKSQKDAEKVRKDGQHSMQFEAAPKIKGDWLKKERERNREHDAAMGRTATGRKKPTRTMTSTQKSLASFREQMAEGGMKRIATTQSNKIDRMASGDKKGLETFKKKPTAKEAFEPHMMYDPKTGKGYKAEKEADHLRMKKMGYTHDKPEVNEKYKIMHKTMSAALQHAYDEAEKKGYEVDKDDIDNKVAMGPRKPSSGKTNSYNLGLSKKGKPVKQKLHVQVYNMDNKGYELNMYVS
jgi:hypothetical protein